MSVRGVLFDLDGTLLDSLADIGESMNSVLEAMGFPGHSLDSYRAFVGDGVAVLAERALPGRERSPERVAEAVSRMRVAYGARPARKTRPYQGIPGLLDELVAGGFALGVLSNKPHDLTVSLVRSLLGRWPFRVVFGERHGVPRKPDPAAALEAASLLGLSPSEVLYVGDTPTDVATAKAAGMPMVAACWGFRDEAELRAAGACRFALAPRDVAGFAR